MATYDVKDVNGVEHLKLEESDVAALVESDQVTSTCPMKKSPMPSWSTAAKFDFLTNLLDEQRKRIAAAAAQARSDNGMFSQKELTDQQKVALAEEKKFVAKPAPPMVRLKAFFIDFLFAIFKAVPLELAAIAAVYFIATFTASSLPKPSFPEDTKIKKAPATFAAFDAEALPDYPVKAGFVFKDAETKTDYICLSSEKGKAVWIKCSTAGRIAVLAVFVFFAWEFLMLGWGLCAHGQTRGMRQNDLTLYNAKDIRVELNGFQIFVSVLLTLLTWTFAWIFVLAMKRSPAELVSFTRCSSAD